MLSYMFNIYIHVFMFSKIVVKIFSKILKPKLNKMSKNVQLMRNKLQKCYS